MSWRRGVPVGRTAVDRNGFRGGQRGLRLVGVAYLGRRDRLAGRRKVFEGSLQCAACKRQTVGLFSERLAEEPRYLPSHGRLTDHVVPIVLRLHRARVSVGELLRYLRQRAVQNRRLLRGVSVHRVVVRSDRRHANVAEVPRVELSALAERRAFVDLLVALEHGVVNEIRVRDLLHGVRRHLHLLALVLVRGRPAQRGRAGHDRRGSRGVDVLVRRLLLHLLQLLRGRRANGRESVRRRAGSRVDRVVVLDLLLVVEGLLERGGRYVWLRVAHLRLLLLLVNVVLVVDGVRLLRAHRLVVNGGDLVRIGLLLRMLHLLELRRLLRLLLHVVLSYVGANC